MARRKILVIPPIIIPNTKKQVKKIVKKSQNFGKQQKDFIKPNINLLK